MTISKTGRRYPENVIGHIVANHMRLVPDDAELYIDAHKCLMSAFDIAENHTNRIIVGCDVVFGLNGIEKVVEIPTAPVTEIVEIAYYDSSDVRRVLDAESYSLSASEHRTMIEFRSIRELSTSRTLNRVQIVAKCGYRDYKTPTAGSVESIPFALPAAIEAAVQLIAGTLMDAEGDVIIGRQVNALPISAQRLLMPYRIAPYGRED